MVTHNIFIPYGKNKSVPDRTRDKKDHISLRENKKKKLTSFELALQNHYHAVHLLFSYCYGVQTIFKGTVL